MRQIWQKGAKRGDKRDPIGCEWSTHVIKGAENIIHEMEADRPSTRRENNQGTWEAINNDITK